MKNKTTGKMPTANLAINKSRIKKYGKSKTIPSYYLEKGQEFQIELFNPTQGKILTTIKLNNKPISGGLVIRPGERVFLDRFLDTNKKFLFDTYNVDNTKSAKKAIEPNGDVEIAFFKEVEPTQTTFFSNGCGNATLDWMGDINTTTGGDYTTNNDTVFITTNSTPTINFGGNTDLNFVQSNISQDTFGATSDAFLSLDGDVTIKGDLHVNGTFTSPGVCSQEMDNSFLRATSKNLKGKRSRISENTPILTTPTTIETGRVEKGSNSKQDLREASGDFEMMSFHIIKYKLSPKSQKQLTSVDYYTKHCTNCGGRCKTKFCAFCGKQQ
jgi:hypothetical protein|tara:strand:- start:47 stop:1027 length:981 start_codon:yes stop_codon:yes gene_type:complete